MSFFWCGIYVENLVWTNWPSSIFFKWVPLFWKHGLKSRFSAGKNNKLKKRLHYIFGHIWPLLWHPTPSTGYPGWLESVELTSVHLWDLQKKRIYLNTSLWMLYDTQARILVNIAIAENWIFCAFTWFFVEYILIFSALALKSLKISKKITPPPNLKIIQCRGGRYRIFSGATIWDYSHSTPLNCCLCHSDWKIKPKWLANNQIIIPNFQPGSGVNLIRFRNVCFYTGAKHPQNFRLLKPMVKVPQGPWP